MLATLVLISFACPTPATGAQASTSTPPVSVVKGTHFSITAHFDDPKIAAEALAAAESVWAPTVEMFGAPAIGAEQPLVVHLYRTAADYERVEEELTGGAFKRNLAFTSHKTGEAHVALQPELSDEILAKTGLPHLTREQIAHEAVHVIVGRAWPNHETLPAWLKEGSATWISQEAMQKTQRVRDAMHDPYTAQDAVRVKRLAEEGDLPSLVLVLEEKVGDLDFLDRYAVWHHAFRWLRDGKRAEVLERILAEARRMGGGADHAAAVGRLALAALSEGTDVAALDGELAAYVRALEPRWDEVYRSLSTSGDTWLQAAFPKTNAICWQTADVGADRYEVSGEVEVFAGKKQQLNLLLARTPNGFVQVAMTAGSGVVVFEYDNRRSGDEQWKRLGGNDVPALVAGKWIPFRARVAKSKLTIDIAGKQVCEVDVGDHPMRGAWGLGALAGSAGAWRKVKLVKR